MVKKDLAAQNVITIRSAEDPDDFSGFGGTGYTIPPVGTYKTGTTIETLDNSTTAADNTPGEAQFEIIEGETSLSYPLDDDDKEAMDISGVEVEHDPGDEKIDLSVEMWELKDSERFGGARCFHPTYREYKRSIYYPRYEMLVIAHPLDSSDNPLQVDKNLSKSDIAKAAKVLYFRDVIFKNKTRSHDAGDKVRSTLTGHAIQRHHYMNYIFGAELYGDGAGASKALVVGNNSLDTQPLIPTRLKITLDTFVGSPGTMTITGTNCRGDAISEVVAITADGTYYTDKVFATVNTNGIVVATITSANALIEADELY